MLLCLQNANSMVLLASSKLSALKSLITMLSMNEEDVFGLEYDLDLFNIVVVPDFNMGAVESKSLNICFVKFFLTLYFHLLCISFD
ncbi:hypothetical protein ACSBR1_016752 [Camellia fascicularis]